MPKFAITRFVRQIDLPSAALRDRARVSAKIEKSFCDKLMPRPKSRATTTIRIPAEYKDLLLDFVRQLDRLKQGDRFDCTPIVVPDWVGHWRKELKL